MVAAVSTPEASPGPLQLTLEAHPVTVSGGATLRVENPTEHPIAGRVVVVLPDGLATDPESMAVQVAARGQTTVPLVLENRGALLPGSYPAYALFEYADADGHRLAIARTDLGVVQDAGTTRARPLFVGLGALVTMLALFGFAWRRAAARA